MVRCLAVFLPVKTAAIQLQDSSITNAPSETVAILCMLIALSFIINRRNVIDLPPPPPTHHHHHYSFLNSLDRLLTKVFRYLNFTVVFNNLFSIVDSTIKSYFETQTIINQAHSGLAAAYSMQGRRHNMEDCFSLRNKISQELGIEYYAVFDGHGGQNAALYADKEIFESIARRIKDILSKQKDNESESCTVTLSTISNKIDSCPATLKSKTTDYKKFESLSLTSMKNILSEEVINVDKRLVETFTRRSDISGTTALIAIRLVHSNKLLVANVGDSRGILCDSKGATIPLSFDHKPYQLKEYRRILEAGGYISLKGVYRVNGILAISRALGDYPLKDNRLIIPDPDILSFDLNELNPKFMIMATDGFWDTFSNENAVQFVHNELSRISKMEMNDSISSVALQIAKQLAKEAYTRESYDNITVIVVLFNENSKLASTAKSTFMTYTASQSSPIKSGSNL